jgi:hypothetical protein
LHENLDHWITGGIPMTTLRRTGTTSVAVLAGLIATLGVAHTAAPEWVRRAGLDLWNMTEISEELRETNQESVRLQDEAERLRESIEAAGYITTRLIARELSLAEATSLLEPLLEQRHGFKAIADPSHPAPTFRKSVARSLIDRVRRALHADPRRLASLEAQLEDEYVAMQ